MKTARRKIIVTAVFGLLLTGLSATAMAVHPQAWTHATEQDYSDGQFDNVIVNNFGELALGQELKKITALANIAFVNGFAEGKKGEVYFITSMHGKVYKITGDHADEFFSPPAEHGNLLSMASDAAGNLLVGACADTPDGGGSAQLLRIATGADGKAAAEVLFDDPAVSYIWSICPMADGTVYIGTGPHGQVWKIPAEKAGGKPSVVLETKAKNVLALIEDSKGNVLAGTDGNGLVIRIDGKSGKPFVLLDAGDVDITALAQDKEGNVYAAAGQPAEPGEDNGAEAPGTPSKPGKVEPEIPDAPHPPEPADATEPSTEHAPGKHGKQARHEVRLPGGDILGENAPPDAIKDLMAKIKAEEAGAAPHPKGPGEGEAGTGKGEEPGKGPGAGPAPEEGQPSKGNILYKIAPDGTTNAMLHLQDTLLALLNHDGELLIGTGSEGKLYSAKPASETQALIARVDDENIMTLFQTRDGAIYAGTSDNGEIFTLSGHRAAHGTYVSKVLDAGNAATWGSATLTATLPEGAKATIATRSGNVENVKDNENFWSDWSDELPANGYKPITSPAAKYLQYRVTLDAQGKADGPIVAQTRVGYQVQNLPPVLKNLSTGTPSDTSGGDEPLDPTAKVDAGSHVLHVYWDASDPNHDQLVFRVLYRQVGTTLWVQLAKDLKDPSYDWNTKEIADGKYQIKVIASDAPDNTPETAKAVARVTPVITINNTPPAINDLKAVQGDDKTVTVSGKAEDVLSPITDVRFQIDSDTEWHAAAASGTMFDSPSEGFSGTTRVLPAGEHRITVKVTDAQGNVSYKAAVITVK